MNKQQFKTYGLALVIFAVILGVMGVTRLFGYRITLRGFVKASTIEIVVEKAGSKVFINNSKEATTSTDNEVVSLKNRTPGTYEILISKDGYWPWVKQVVLAKDTTKRVSSMTLRSNTEGVIIPKEDPEYVPLNQRIASTTTPTKELPTKSTDGMAIAWVDGSKILMQWKGTPSDAPEGFCAKECDAIEIFTSTEPIRNLEFYKDKNDILLFSASNGIFAIEADKNSIQNFQPLYKGVSHALGFFSDREDNVLYAKDGEMLLIINL